MHCLLGYRKSLPGSASAAGHVSAGRADSSSDASSFSGGSVPGHVSHVQGGRHDGHRADERSAHLAHRRRVLHHWVSLKADSARSA